MTTSRLEDVLPLSPLQQGLLFHAQYDEQGPDFYTMQFVFEIEGTLDAEALRAACAAALRRHANLRAGFRYRKNGDPVQVIPREVKVDWTDTDLSALPAASQEAELARLLAADRARRVDPRRPPLLRFTLFHLGGQRYRFLLTNHHILLDGWSRAVLIGELFELYGSHGDAAGLRPVTPYREYLSWLSRQDHSAAAAAWRQVIDGVDEPTLLAAAPASPRQPVAARHARFELPAKPAAALAGWAAKHAFTINTVVQAAWAIVLGQLTGRDDVVFGGTVSGRPPEIPGIESMVGLFINTLPVRVRLDPAEPLGALLARLQDQQAALMDYPYLGLAEIQRLTPVTGELFDTLVVFENYPVDTEGLQRAAGGLGIVDGHSHEGTHYPLTLMVNAGATLGLEIGYRPELLDRDRIEVIGRALLRLLGTAPDQHATPTGRLALLSAAEQQRVLNRWNNTVHPVRQVPLPELFQAQAARTPDAVAVRYADRQLSYAELNARANRLAHLLIRRGVGPERTVALALPRSPELITALCAVLKAGAAYLPVDPEYPADRIAYMLGDAGPALVLTNRETARTLPTAGNSPLFILDDPASEAAVTGLEATDPGDADRTAALSVDHPAYVIYTSGSTGRPKGVAMTGRALVNLFAWHEAELPGGPGNRTAQFTAISFDVSAQEILSALLSGRTLVIPDDSTRRDPAAFVRWLDHHQVNEVYAPNLVIDALCDEAREAGLQLPALRHLAQAGEALVLTKPIREFHAAGQTARLLHNHYGPTETHVVTACTLPERTGDWPDRPTIGRPIWNTAATSLTPPCARCRTASQASCIWPAPA